MAGPYRKFFPRREKAGPTPRLSPSHPLAISLSPYRLISLGIRLACANINFDISFAPNNLDAKTQFTFHSNCFDSLSFSSERPSSAQVGMLSLQNFPSVVCRVSLQFVGNDVND